jgi:hypothetical protein
VLRKVEKHCTRLYRVLPKFVALIVTYIDRSTNINETRNVR